MTRIYSEYSDLNPTNSAVEPFGVKWGVNDQEYEPPTGVACADNVMDLFSFTTLGPSRVISHFQADDDIALRTIILTIKDIRAAFRIAHSLAAASAEPFLLGLCH